MPLGLISISRDASFLSALPAVFQQCWRRETSCDPEIGLPKIQRMDNVRLLHWLFKIFSVEIFSGAK